MRAHTSQVILAETLLLPVGASSVLTPVTTNTWGTAPRKGQGGGRRGEGGERREGGKDAGAGGREEGGGKDAGTVYRAPHVRAEGTVMCSLLT